MNRTSLIVAVVLGMLLSTLAACSNRDKAVMVEADDPEMAAAIAKARSTLPHFWQVFDKRERGESKFSLKVEIKDDRGRECFWVIDLERGDGKTTGAINNDPNVVAGVRLGDRIEIPEADIADWLYMRDGKMVGNETLKPLLKRMPAEEAARYKSLMADP